MKTILVVNGEDYWEDYFPDNKVVRKRVQDSNWLLKNGELLVLDAESVVRPDLVLWRVGAIRPHARQVNALNLIDLSGIPCVNPAPALRRGYDRLSMLAELRRAGIPHNHTEVATQTSQLKNISLPFPFVVKVGNYHGGFGKVRVHDEESWQEARSLAHVAETYATVEPFIDYVRDLRFLVIGDEVRAMSRRGQSWKANVATQSYELIAADATWTGYARKLRAQLGVDILALDVLETKGGDMICLEYNDIPGLSGFPEAVRRELVEVVRERMG